MDRTSRLLVVDDYTLYTTDFPLRSKANIRGVLIDWITAIRRQLSTRFQQDLQILRLHSDRGAQPLALCPCARDLAHTTLDEGGGGGGLAMRRRFGPGARSPLSAIPPRASSLLALFSASSLASPPTPWQFYHPASRCVLSSHDVNFYESGPAPSGVSQVDPPPLVEPLEVLSNTSGPAKGGDPIADDTAATHRSPRLETPPGFPPRPSSPPPQTIAVDSGAAGGGDTGGADSGGAGPEVADSKGAESGVAGSGGASSGGADTEGAASPSGGGVVGAPSGGFGDGQQLRDWVVWRGRVAGAWSTGAGGTGARGGSQDHHKVREQARGHMASPHART
ncbi:unnamed protein product [Closterium sp. NIES-54]